MTTEERLRCGIMGMTDKVSGEDGGGWAGWQRCEKIGMDKAAEEMRDGNRRDVGRQRWRNGLEEWRQTGKILTGNNYQPEAYRCSDNLGVVEMTYLHGDLEWSKTNYNFGRVLEVLVRENCGGVSMTTTGGGTTGTAAAATVVTASSSDAGSEPDLEGGGRTREEG